MSSGCGMIKAMGGAVHSRRYMWPPATLLLPPSSAQSLASFFSTPQNQFNRCRASSTSFRPPLFPPLRRSKPAGLVLVEKEDTEVQYSTAPDDDDPQDPTPQDLEYVAQIKRVLELLQKNRDMLFGEVKLTIMIEDPREVERRKLLGIEDFDAPTRDDLAAALDEVNEGKVPKDRVAVRMLAEEMTRWPNLEVEVPKKGRRKSLYAKVTDTGVDPQVAAKRANVDWDSAAEFADADVSNEKEVPALLGYGALYLITAFPIIIGVSVVLILFYNSLQ